MFCLYYFIFVFILFFFILKQNEVIYLHKTQIGTIEGNMFSLKFSH